MTKILSDFEDEQFDFLLDSINVDSIEMDITEQY